MDVGTWIFGYGSLLWNPGFPFRETCVVYVDGFARRFYQGSTDHRGTPEAPGRVVTLVRDQMSTCWGLAYHVPPEKLHSTISYLDHREKGGFTKKRLGLNSIKQQRRIQNAVTYVASPGNPNYLGACNTSEMAQQIYGASGPSGKNREYLFKLSSTLRKIGAFDAHVFDLECSVRKLEMGES